MLSINESLPVTVKARDLHIAYEALRVQVERERELLDQSDDKDGILRKIAEDQHAENREVLLRLAMVLALSGPQIDKPAPVGPPAELVIVNAEDLKNLLIGSQDYIERGHAILKCSKEKDPEMLKILEELQKSQDRCKEAYANTGCWYVSPHYAEAFLRVINERRHQIVDKGWTPEHDLTHENHEIAYGAMAYLKAYTMLEQGPGQDIRQVNKIIDMMDWPWHATSTFKAAGNPVDNLVKGIAMLVAELERRLSEKVPPNPGPCPPYNLDSY